VCVNTVFPPKKFAKRLYGKVLDMNKLVETGEGEHYKLNEIQLNLLSYEVYNDQIVTIYPQQEGSDYQNYRTEGKLVK
jgi:hypothetical protein